MTASTDRPVGTEFNDVPSTLPPYEPGRQDRNVSPPQGPLVLFLYERDPDRADARPEQHGHRVSKKISGR